MGLLENFMDVFKRPAASAAELLAAAESAAKHQELLIAQRDAVSASRRDVLVDGTDADLDALEKRKAALNLEIERTGEREVILRERAANMAEAEAEAVRQKRYSAAHSKAESIKKRWRRFGELHGEMVQILVEACQAQKDIDAANADLPAGAAAIVEPEIEVRGLNAEFRVGRMREKIKLPPFSRKDGSADYVNLGVLFNPPAPVNRLRELWRATSSARGELGMHRKTEFIPQYPDNPLMQNVGKSVTRGLNDAEQDELIRAKFKDEGAELQVDPAWLSKLSPEEAYKL